VPFRVETPILAVGEACLTVCNLDLLFITMLCQIKTAQEIFRKQEVALVQQSALSNSGIGHFY
jgi:hypothetical protein